MKTLYKLLFYSAIGVNIVATKRMFSSYTKYSNAINNINETELRKDIDYFSQLIKCRNV